MEKRLVDADSITCENTWKEWSDDHGDYVVCTAPTVLTIPENPTNGDMIKALFPNIEFKQEGVVVAVKGLDSDKGSLLGERCFWADWWNAPYKENNNDK